MPVPKAWFRRNNLMVHYVRTLTEAWEEADTTYGKLGAKNLDLLA